MSFFFFSLLQAPFWMLYTYQLIYFSWCPYGESTLTVLILKMGKWSGVRIWTQIVPVEPLAGYQVGRIQLKREGK